jgi:hypothetical protein
MGDKWLEAYGGQTTEELLSLRDVYRIDSLVLAFEEAIQRKAASGPISREERYVLAIEALEREVNNGGYDQFFVNMRSEFLDVVEEALRAIGCPTTASITQDAINALDVAIDATDEEVEDKIYSDDPGMAEALAACDDRYYESGEPIADRLFEWIDAHRAAVRVGAV